MKFEKFIRKHRWFMYDVFQALVHDCGIRGREYQILHARDFSRFWVYFNRPGGLYVITFPADILYINATKGVKNFVGYIKTKLTKGKSE